MDHRIEKHIPAPPQPTERESYPFIPLMEVGDSILVEGDGASSDKCKAYNAAIQHGRYHGKRFTGRKDPGKPGYIRIWRIE